MRAAFDPDTRMNPHKVLPDGARCGDFAMSAIAMRRRRPRASRRDRGSIHPHAKADVVEALREANAAAPRLLVVGGRHHMDKGEPCEVDGELWTTQLDRLVAYEPAEMLAVVEAGMRVGDLNRVLAEGGQEWPIDAPPRPPSAGRSRPACVPRRLKVGRIATRCSRPRSSPATAGS